MTNVSFLFTIPQYTLVVENSGNVIAQKGSFSPARWVSASQGAPSPVSPSGGGLPWDRRAGSHFRLLPSAAWNRPPRGPWPTSLPRYF